MAKKTKTVKNYTYHGLGFPIVIQDAKVVETKFGIGLDPKLRSKVKDYAIKALLTEISRYTGAQLKFIRKYLELTQQDFADKLGMGRTKVVSLENTNLELAPLSKGEIILIKALLSKGKEEKEHKRIRPKELLDSCYKLIDLDFTRPMPIEALVI